MRVLLLIFAVVALASARWDSHGHSLALEAQPDLDLEQREKVTTELSDNVHQTDQHEDSDDQADVRESDEDDADSTVDKGQGHHGKKPRFCKKHKCLPFKTVKRYRGFELRCYKKATYVVTKADKIDEKDFGPLFGRLFDYIRGANVDHATFEMTAPVLAGMFYNISTHKTRTAMSFYLPYSSPPAPTNDKVRVYNSRGFCAYVRTFFGKVKGRDRRLYKQLYILSKAIRRYRKDYSRGVSVYAGYSSPWDKIQYNEVWRFPSRREPKSTYVPEFIPTSTWDVEGVPLENSSEVDLQSDETLNKEDPADKDKVEVETNEEEPQAEFEGERFVPF